MPISSRTNVRRVLAIAMVVCALGAATVAVAQETTGRLVGQVTLKTDQSPLPGVAVEALHVPTGTRYTAVTGGNGRFSILNVRVGGPYSITANISGFRPQTQKGIEVALGESRTVNFGMELESVAETVVVTAESAPLISPDRMGSTAALPEEQIKALPTVRRQIQDFARTNPYSSTRPPTTSPARVLAVAGKNNRYNTIQIDGAVNNDLFGLAEHRHSGRPGGHAADQPRLDPGDPARRLPLRRQAGRLHRRRHQRHHPRRLQRVPRLDLRLAPRARTYVGDKVPTASGDPLDKPIANFDEDQIRLPARRPDPERQALLLRQRRERNRREQPTGVSADGSTATQFNKPEDAAAVQGHPDQPVRLRPGRARTTSARTTDSDLFFGRLDFNLNESNNVTLRHNYVDADARLRRGPLVDPVPVRERRSTRSPTRRTRRSSSSTASSAPTRSTWAASATRRSATARTTPGHLPDDRHRREHRLPAAPRRHGALLRRELARPGHPRGHRRLHPHQGQPHDHDRHSQRVLRLHERLPARLLRLLPVRDGRRLRQAGPIAAEYSISFSIRRNPKAATSFAAQQWGLYVGDQWRVNDRLTLSLGLRGDMPRLPDTPSMQPARLLDVRHRHERRPEQRRDRVAPPRLQPRPGRREQAAAPRRRRRSSPAARPSSGSPTPTRTRASRRRR